MIDIILSKDIIYLSRGQTRRGGTGSGKEAANPEGRHRGRQPGGAANPEGRKKRQTRSAAQERF